jgi:DNA-binding NarL/FixJ family response regulator
LHGVDPFRLVLVDLELPDGNGMELLSELAHTRPPRSSPRCIPTTTICFPRCSAAPTATC